MKASIIQSKPQTEDNAFRRIAAFVLRLGRKSRTFRTVVNVGFGGPVWSKQDVRLFAREGYKGNPYMYSACDALVKAMADPPPVLYRVRGGSSIEKAYKSGYNLDTSIRGFSAKNWSLQTAALQAVRKKTSQLSLITGATPAIARGMAVKQLAVSGELEIITAHPILDLLARPNGWYQTSYGEFVTAWGLSMLLAGEIFTEPIGEKGDEKAPNELYVLPAHELTPERGTSTNPIPAWRYRGRSTDSFKYSPDPLKTEIFFNKLYDPINPLRGLSPVEACVRSIDLNNQARGWNLNFLKNAGIPPALVTGEFDDTGAAAIHEAYAEDVAGEQNVGRLVTLSGKNLQYHQLSMDAAKLHWGDIINLTAREIAIVFGVPPEILGDATNKTYSNYQEARLALYQDRALPLTDFMYGAWNASWVRRFGDDLFLDYDADQIVAIQTDIKQAYERLEAAKFLTINEKRAAVGYENVDGGDVIFVPITSIPLEVAASGDIEELKEYPKILAELLASTGIEMNGLA